MKKGEIILIVVTCILAAAIGYFFPSTTLIHLENSKILVLDTVTNSIFSVPALSPTPQILGDRVYRGLLGAMLILLLVGIPGITSKVPASLGGLALFIFFGAGTYSLLLSLSLFSCFLWNRAESDLSRKILVLLLPFISFWIAGSLAALTIGIAIFFIYFTTIQSSTTKLAIMFFISILLSFAAPKIFFPELPFGNSVVPSMGVPWLSRPLLGQDLSLVTVNYDFIQKVLILPCVVLFPILLSLFKGFRSAKHYYFSLLLLSFLVAQFYFRGEVFSSLPLSGMSRLIPGLFFFAAEPIVMSALVLVCCFHLPGNRILLLSAYLLLLTSLTTRWNWPDNQRTKELLLTTPGEHLVSPSFYPRYIRKEIESGKLSEHSLAKDSLDIFLNGNLVPSKKATDGKSKTRVTLSQGHKKNDSACFDWKQNLEIAGVQLDTGTFFTDYPRGIRIEKVTNCLDTEKGEELFSETPWLGTLAVKDGYHYFSNQSDARFVFEHPVNTRAVRLTLTTGPESHDWSLSNFKLLLPENP